MTSYLFDTTKDPNSVFFASFIDGAYHSFIHVGYGLEFSVSPVVAEGLAMAAMTLPRAKPILLDPPTSSPLTSAMDAAIGTLTSLTSTLGLTASKSQTSRTKHPSGWSIVDAVYSDRSLDGVIKWEDENKYHAMLERAAEKVKEYAKSWVVDAWSKEDVVDKMKELMGISMAVYAGTTRPGQNLRLDFFLMHALTSSYFLPIYVVHLSPPQAARLLQAHFAMTFGFYIARGRPRAYLEENLSAYKSQLGGYDKENPWLTVIQRTIAHDDVHLVKVIRALIYGSTFLAHNNKDEEMKETPGEHKETSQYWLNSAKMTLDAIRDGRWWVHDAIGFDEAWEPGRISPHYSF